MSNYAGFIGLLDIPTARSSHKIPTPKGGGIGLLFAFIIVSFALEIPPGFWLPVTAVSAISFFGDKLDISPTIRLFFQFFAASFVIKAISASSQAMFLFSQHVPLWALYIIACIYIVGTANFYNFMDGINGIAAVTGFVGFVLLALFGLAEETGGVWVSLSFSMGAACLGFLPFNCPRARVFMGDVGSILLGFLFSALVVVISDSLATFLLLSSFLFPFYVDELVTMWERIRDGDSLLKPHRRHLYQVLANEAGIPHWKVSIGYGFVQASLGLVFWKLATVGAAWFLLAVGLACTIWIVVNNRVKARYLSS